MVLDTPPDSHALDFLARPDVLSRFREQRVMNWLVKPFLLASKFGLGRLMSMGEKMMGGVAQVTGIKALHSFAEFLVLIQQVIDGFHSASEGIVKILHEATSGFLLVTAPTPSGLRTGTDLGVELHRISYPLDGIVLNRTLPEDLSQELSTQAPIPPEKTFLYNLWKRKQNEENVLSKLLTALETVHKHPLLVLNLEEKDYLIHNLSSVLEFAKSF